MSHSKQNLPFFFLALVCAAVLLLMSPSVSAQTVTGTLQGTVSDAKGAVLPGAEVVIRNMETGQERAAKTNSEGLFVAPFLPLGRYTVTVSSTGFSKVSQENIEVTLNQTRVVAFTLNPSVVTEAVVVTAEAAPINTTNAEIKGSLNAQEITEKPTFNQGSFLTLAETFTGFQENPTSGQNNPTASSGSSINFNGTGTRGATFQINGVNNDDSSENQNRQGASLATIKEFQVITNNFSAEFGRGYGAVVLVQTKSGTNNVHGDVYWYHNDSALNATNNVFAPGSRKPVARRNQFGFTSGFPLFQNRLFSFLSLDHTENTGANNFNRDVFTLAERDPANWFKQTPANDTPSNRAFVKSVIDRFANAVPNDPASGARVFRGQQAFDFPARDYSGRLDWNPRSEDNVFARWQYTRQKFNADDIIIGERANQNHKQQNFGLNWTHTFAPTLLNTATFGFNRLWHRRGIDQDVGWEDFGGPCSSWGCRKSPYNLQYVVSIAGSLSTGTNGTFGQPRTGFQVSDTLSWIKGAHAISTGVSYTRAGVWLYSRAAVARDRLGNVLLWALVITLAALYLAAVFGAPPPSEQALAITGFLGWLFVAWGYWIDRHRAPVAAI